MSLSLVPIQLDLFPHEPHASRPNWREQEDAERDRRTAEQWRRSILQYLEFRAGEPWRHLGDPSQRFSAERHWYLNAYRETIQAQFAECVESETPTPIAARDDARSETLLKEPKAKILDRLLAADSMISDRRIISGLGKRKLISMLIAAQDRNAAPLERAS